MGSETTKCPRLYEAMLSKPLRKVYREEGNLPSVIEQTKQMIFYVFNLPGTKIHNRVHNKTWK